MSNRKLLSAALVMFGVIFCLIVPLAMVWPSGWAWHDGAPGASPYFPMIAGVYATLGIFLIRAAKDPAANASLIWFTVVSSIVHAAIMAVQSLQDAHQAGHLVGDVPALLLVAVVLGALMHRTNGEADAPHQRRSGDRLEA